jgi:methyl acetate hydrolase
MMQSELERILGEAVAGGDLIEAAAAVATPTGTFAAAAGQRSEGTEMTPDSIVWIASMTKAVTAVAAMQLVEQGRVALDQPCHELVPYLAEAQVLDGFDDDGSPKLRPPARPITLRHLLSHTAGFGYDFTDPLIARFVAEQGLPSIVDGTAAAYEQPLLFDPGDRWAYGINIDWAGQVVEAATKTRLDDHLRSAILRAARNARHRIRSGCGRPVPHGRHAPAHARRFGPGPVRDQGGPRVSNGGRRPLRHRRRLSALRAHDARWRRARGDENHHR